MATQWSEYAGNNNDNNRVIVDYVRHKVFFQSVLKATSVKRLVEVSMILVFSWIFIYSMVVIVPLTVVYGVMYFVSQNNIFFELLSVFLEQSPLYFVLPVAVISWLQFYFLRWRNEEWRRTGFPVWNATMGQMVRSLFWFVKNHVDEWHTVRPKAVRHREFILPSFSNVSLEYKATGDFGKYLTRVTVDNLFHKNDADWYAVFHFSKTPRKGTLRVKYD